MENEVGKLSLNILKKPMVATLVIAFCMAMIGLGLFLEGQNVFWMGFWAIAAFYALVFYVGAKAAQRGNTDNEDDVMLAGRSMPLILATFTMSATWIDGGYINGTAEFTANKDYGLMWVQAPWGYALSLIIGGLFFARKMRRYGFRTMLDPLTQRYGQRMTAVLFIPALLGEIFWTATILTALGMTFSVVTDLSPEMAIIISAVVCLAYTAVGGLWAIAYTDVLLIVTIVLGLTCVVVNALPSVGGLTAAWAFYQEKMGALASPFPNSAVLGNATWSWWDSAILLVLGGIPWQVYFQRVLSSRNERTASNLSILGGFFCFIVAIPAVLIGVIGYVTTQQGGWAAFGVEAPVPASIAPFVMRYLTHPVVATLGLGAIAAAVLSSVAASVLSAASMAGWNVIKPLRKHTTTQQLSSILKWNILLIGGVATILALKVQSVYTLWVLCSDFVFCLLFPALLCALFDPKANKAGALAGFLVAAFLRFGGGEAAFGIQPYLPYPTDANGLILIPFKTIAMLSGLVTLVVVSRLTQRKYPAQVLRVC